MTLDRAMSISTVGLCGVGCGEAVLLRAVRSPGVQACPGRNYTGA